MNKNSLTLKLAIALFCAASVRADAADSKEFGEAIGPLLKAKCIACHGPDNQEGGLRLDSLAAATKGGDTGPAIVPGDSEKSLLVKAVQFDDPDLQMPPKDRLSDKQIADLTHWVKAGAAWSEDLDAWSPGFGKLASAAPAKQEVFGAATVDPRNPIHKLFGGERLDLWSLKKPERRGPFDESNLSIAARSAMIDAEIQQRLIAVGLTPSAEAERRTLIRRLTFDLTGLPPTPIEVAEFVADDSPGAYDRLVTRLLASPHYGERQARLWLDVVRYADTHGYERDEFRPLIWQYRDYVIRAFNEDKPFDLFIREQLAGDEMVSGPPRNPAEADALIATGYLRLGQWDSTASIFQEENRLRAEMMADVTNTTASAFLGLTMSCCQCHDHKFDPFSQADHYRLRAFFAAVKPRDDLVIEMPDTLAEINRHNAALDGQIEPLKTEQSKLDKDAEQDQPRHAELTKQIAALAEMKREPRVAMGAVDSGPIAPATHIFYQGDFHSPRDEVSPGFVSVLYPGPSIVEAPHDNTTGRRLALANWIASPDNPWTARVIVNQVWQQHFGTGLVATPNDFGYSGARPTHPELLDELALSLVTDGWSIKRLHQAIVMSATYRQTSAWRRGGDAETGKQRDRATRERGEQERAESLTRQIGAAQTDPDNRLLWRQNVRRLDAETLRDSLLTVSGKLKPYQEGKPLWPEVSQDLLEAQPAILEAIEGKDEGRMQGWYADVVEETDVRSVFLIRKRCLPIPFLQAFDLPDTTVSCARRDTTVVAPQALMLLNSPLAVRLAEAFADRVADPFGKLDFDDAGRLAKVVEIIFQLALVRVPDADELALASDLLKMHSRQHRAAGAMEQAERMALVDLCRGVLNLNEFVYID